tara:strand:- start:417 stop:992 length:576 start_codon:yes stop_codon:yes gene_type:complete
MIMEKLFETRYQVYQYTDKIPDKTLAENLIEKTFKLTASKQNIMPYKVHVLGPDCKEEKKKIYDHVQKVTGGGHNLNIHAPYNLIFTTRLVTNPSSHVQQLIDEGHDQPCTDPQKYKKDKHNISLEIGMFAKILTGLCLENELGVSYQLCFKDWQYENEEVLFSMQFGYPLTTRLEKGDYKPHIDDVIKFK